MLRILSETELKKITAAGTAILEETGVRLLDEDIRGTVIEHGAEPDPFDGTRVHIPENMAEKYFRLCPGQFSLKNRAGESVAVRNGSRSMYYTGNATQYVRGASKNAKEIGIDEFIEFTRVIDRLENIDGLVGTSIGEFPPNYRDFTGFRLMAMHTRKHLRPCIYTPSGGRAIIEMADAILDGSPIGENMFFTLGYSIVSPLTWSDTALGLFEATKGFGIPVMINSEPMAGGTSPVTLAGSLALADAEILSGIVINQIIEPGRPCIYNAGFAHVMDMRTMTALTGAPENALMQAAGAELAAYRGLPCASWSLSDAPVLDSQAAYEKMMTLLAHTLSGTNMIWGIGNFETSKTISPESAVIDNEMIGNCLRMKQGITVDEEHLAIDVIKKNVFVGNFLETDHTFRHYREEIRMSSLPNRSSRTIWKEQGSKTVEEKACDEVKKILSSNNEVYLRGSQIEKLDRIQCKWIERVSKSK